MAQSAGPAPGQIYYHPRYYEDPPGVWHPKYFLLLCSDRSGDFVFRLLTSRRNDRPRDPPCYHGNPYPGFYLGVLGDSLVMESWLDLRKEDRELESTYIQNQARLGAIQRIFSLDSEVMCKILDCASRAIDTTERHSQLMRDQMARFQSA